jgi:predicted RNase H-like HicB family nuclease
MVRRVTVEIIPDVEQGGFTARVPDIPAYGEGETEEEAIEDLREALRAYVEAFATEDERGRLKPPSSLRQLDLELEDFARA